jgi:hypothetical protein
MIAHNTDTVNENNFFSIGGIYKAKEKEMGWCGRGFKGAVSSYLMATEKNKDATICIKGCILVLVYYIGEFKNYFRGKLKFFKNFFYVFLLSSISLNLRKSGLYPPVQSQDSVL